MPKASGTHSQQPLAPPRYAEWVDYLFGHPVTDPAWYFGPFVPFEASPEDIVALVIHTFKAARHDLSRFADNQVAHGLNHIVSNSCGNLVYALTSKPLSKERRGDVLLAFIDLYRECFDPRCAPVLSHVDQPGGSALNATCYMLWEASPLASASPEPLLNVLYAALHLPNPACQESTLHGLGHHVQTGSGSERAASIIENYLKKGGRSPELTAYARLAQKGRIL